MPYIYYTAQMSKNDSLIIINRDTATLNTLMWYKIIIIGYETIMKREMMSKIK